MDIFGLISYHIYLISYAFNSFNLSKCNQNPQQILLGFHVTNRNQDITEVEVLRVMSPPALYVNISFKSPESDFQLDFVWFMESWTNVLHRGT